jgi:uncharacterized protein YidB (DUF937 family)
MGLLDNLEKQLGGNQQNVLLQAVSGLISNNGGLSGLIARFTQNGLGQHVQSWVGNGDGRGATPPPAPAALAASDSDCVSALVARAWTVLGIGRSRFV